MKPAYAKKLIYKTRDDYNTIADKFANTRKFLSDDIISLKKFIVRNDKVLDLGCGNGRLSELCAEIHIQYIGADISERLVQIAKAHYPDFKFVTLSGDSTLPFEQDSFTKVFCLAVIHHIPGKDGRAKFLAEIKRVLKPGGLAVITAWQLRSKPDIRRQLKLNTFLKVMGLNKLDFGDIKYPFFDDKTTVMRYLHCFSQKELNNLVNSSGLVVLESKVVKRNKNNQNIQIIARKGM